MEQDIDLMPHHQEVDPTTSPHPSNQGDTEILGDNLEEEMHNISFDESQHRVVQSRRVSTPNDYTSPAQFEERVIVSDMRKHLATLANATREYAKPLA